MKAVLLQSQPCKKYFKTYAVAVVLSCLSLCMPNWVHAVEAQSGAQATNLPSVAANQNNITSSANPQPQGEVPQYSDEASTQQKVVNNPYGLGALWQQGDFIAKGTLLILLLLSVVSWYVLVSKFIAQQGLLKQYKQAKQVWQKASSLDAAKQIDPQGAYAYVLKAGVQANARYNPQVAAKVDVHTWLNQALGRAVGHIKNQLGTGLSLLATVGSTSPFIGLFGTVWGIYHALTAIGIAGQASIDKVAGPVGEALIMTAIGLAVAVPAVLGYNFLVRRNKVILEQVSDYAEDVEDALLSEQMPAQLS